MAALLFIFSMNNSYILLTGATGLLGRFLLRDLSDLGRRVAVLVRNSTSQTAVQRVENLLEDWRIVSGAEITPPVVISGDLTKTGLGIDAPTTEWMTKNIGEVLHGAASLSFLLQKNSNEPFATNVVGTANLLDFCKQTRIRRFHHISTAYVCGDRTGQILESDLDVGQASSNAYEQSKIEAEQLVHKASFLESLTVFRPSIVVGDYLDGFTTSFHGLYAPLKFVHTFASSFVGASLESGAILDQFKLSGSERKNLVPVDWVSTAITRIILDRSLHGHTYHLTSDTPTSVSRVCHVFESMLPIMTKQEDPKIATTKNKDINPEILGKMFLGRMEPYKSYWRDDPMFDKRNTNAAIPGLPVPEFDDAALRRLAKFAIDHNFCWPAKIKDSL